MSAPRPLSVEAWLTPAKLVGGVVAFAAGGGVSWATLNAKAEAAQQSAASANAAVHQLGEALGKRMDALESSTAAAMSAIANKQLEAREAQIRLEEQVRRVDERTSSIDRRLEVLLDRLGDIPLRRGSRSGSSR